MGNTDTVNQWPYHVLSSNRNILQQLIQTTVPCTHAYNGIHLTSFHSLFVGVFGGTKQLVALF